MTKRFLLATACWATCWPIVAPASAQTAPTAAPPHTGGSAATVTAIAPQSTPDQSGRPLPDGTIGTAPDTTVPPGQPLATDHAATPDPIATPGDIVVTAQRRSQRLQDVPISVSVIGGSLLARTNLTTLESVSARLPNVKIVSGAVTDFINIRGVGSGQNSGFEQSVGTFVDGLYRGRSKSTRAALFDIEQVEVLKGPQTTFFGNNTVAGALNIITRKPSETWQYNASSLYAFEDGEYNVEAGVGGPITDTLSFRVAGRLAGIDGYVRNRNLDRDAPRSTDRLGRVSLRWEPSANFRSDLRFDIGSNYTRDAYSFVALNCPSPFAGPTDFACPAVIASLGRPTGSEPYYSSYAPFSFSQFKFHELGLTNSLDLGGVTVTSTSGYFHQTYNGLVQFIPSAIQIIPGYDLVYSPSGERFTQYSQELRLQSDTQGPFDYMVGGYYAHSDLDTYTSIGANFIPAFGPIAGLQGSSFRDRTLSAFASATIRPVERLRINLGARYTDVLKRATREAAFGTVPFENRYDFRGVLTPFPLPLQQVVSGIFGSDLTDFPRNRLKNSRFLPSAGVQYDLAPSVMGYATYTKGFKAGGFSGANTAAIFGPETVDAYEVGVKSTLFDRRLTLNVDLFRSDYDNLQETTTTFPGGIPISTVTNAASSRAKGVEASATLRVSPKLSFSSDFAYLDAIYLDYPNGVCTAQQLAGFAATPAAPSCVQDLSGQRRAFAPKFSGNLGATLTLPLAGQQLRVEPLLYFTSAFFTTAQADLLLRQPGNAKVDLRIGYGPENSRWEIALVGKNLTDKATATYRNGLTAGNGSSFALPDRPRSIAIQLLVRK